MNFHNRIAASQVRLARRFGPNGAGQRLIIWWPTTEPTGSDFVRILDVTRGTKNAKNARLGGLAVLENDDAVFAAPSGHFPTAVPPEEGVVFYAGHSEATREKWVCTGSRTASGLTEIDCRRT